MQSAAEAGECTPLLSTSIRLEHSNTGGGGGPLPSAISHCHSDDDDSVTVAETRKARRKLLIASGLCLVFMVAECVGGALANSLAIMTDAAHLFTDLASFIVGLVSIQLASRPATKRMSFGWHRAEVIGALASVLTIWIVTAVLVYLAVERCITPTFEVEGGIMLITSAIGVAVNIVMALTLHQHHGHGHGHGHSHGHENDHGHGHSGSHGHGGDANINVRAAFVHAVGDLLQSLGVLAAACLIYWKPEWKLADPICTFIFSALVMCTTIGVVRDTTRVLMEAAPPKINFELVKQCLLSVPGVVEVHNLRIWSITVGRAALSCHLAVRDDADQQATLFAAKDTLRRKFRAINDVTLQVEKYVSDMDDCQKCKDPKD